MKRRMKPHVVLALAFVCRLLQAGQPGPCINNAADLTRIVVSNQSDLAAFAGKPFEIVGTVVSDGLETIFQDATGHALLLTDRMSEQPNLKPGDVISAKGNLRCHSSGRMLPFATAIRKLRHEQPPKTTDVTGADFVSGRHDYRPVRIRGRVLDIITDEVDPIYAIVILDCDGERIPSSILISDAAPVLGEEIVAEGICQPSPTISRQMIGRTLVKATFTSPCDSPSDAAFDAPELACCRFLQPKELSSSGRRRLCGRVIAVWNHAALIRTGDRLVARLELLDRKRPSCGDAIEAVGLPETDVYMPILRRAHWRPIDDALLPADEPRPQDVALSNIFLDRTGRPRFDSLLHGSLIRTTANVRSLPSANGSVDYMLVGADEWMLPVDISSAVPYPAELTVGCTVEITGVYLLDCQPWRPNAPIPPVNGVKIIVRSPDDIRILSTPPWWTAGRLLVVVGILGAVLLFVVIWNLTLQRVAERRGRKLSVERIARAEAEIKTMERTRLAVELHDTIAQNLTGVSIALDVARQFCPGTKPELQQQIDVADATLDACQVELRNCLWDLRNQALEEPDLNAAIRTALQPHVAGVALDIRFNVARDNLTENTAHAILRIIRELVINATRHGHATHVQIAGVLDPDALRFSVRDDGCGFDAESCPGIAQKHFGLQGIRERLSLLGGRMEIESTANVGTRIAVTIPFPQ